MNKRHPEHSDSHGHGHQHKKSESRKIHQDWRFWTVIAMLVAMGIYVLTMDESMLPWGGSQPSVPAAPAP